MRVLHRRAILALAAVVAFVPPLVAQTTISDADYLELGRKSYDWFLGARFDSLLAHMAADTREAVGGADDI